MSADGPYDALCPTAGDSQRHTPSVRPLLPYHTPSLRRPRGQCRRLTRWSSAVSLLLGCAVPRRRVAIAARVPSASVRCTVLGTAAALCRIWRASCHGNAERAGALDTCAGKKWNPWKRAMHRRRWVDALATRSALDVKAWKLAIGRREHSNGPSRARLRGKFSPSQTPLTALHAGAVWHYMYAENVRVLNSHHTRQNTQRCYSHLQSSFSIVEIPVFEFIDKEARLNTDQNLPPPPPPPAKPSFSLPRIRQY